MPTELMVPDGTVLDWSGKGKLDLPCIWRLESSTPFPEFYRAARSIGSPATAVEIGARNPNVRAYPGAGCDRSCSCHLKCDSRYRATPKRPQNDLCSKLPRGPIDQGAVIAFPRRLSRLPKVGGLNNPSRRAGTCSLPTIAAFLDASWIAGR